MRIRNKNTIISMNTREENFRIRKASVLERRIDWLIDQNYGAHIRESANPMISPFDKLPLLKPIPLSK